MQAIFNASLIVKTYVQPFISSPRTLVSHLYVSGRSILTLSKISTKPSSCEITSIKHELLYCRSSQTHDKVT